MNNSFSGDSLGQKKGEVAGMVHEDSMMFVGTFKENEGLIRAPSIEDIMEDLHNEDEDVDFNEEEKKLDKSDSFSKMMRSVSISDLDAET